MKLKLYPQSCAKKSAKLQNCKWIYNKSAYVYTHQFTPALKNVYKHSSGASDIFHDCTELQCSELYCPALHCTSRHYIVMHCTALQYSAQYCTDLHCTALICTVLLYCTSEHILSVNKKIYFICKSSEGCGGTLWWFLGLEINQDNYKNTFSFIIHGFTTLQPCFSIMLLVSLYII